MSHRRPFDPEVLLLVAIPVGIGLLADKVYRLKRFLSGR